MNLPSAWSEAAPPGTRHTPVSHSAIDIPLLLQVIAPVSGTSPHVSVIVAVNALICTTGLPKRDVT